jgi:hypothetical protein
VDRLVLRFVDVSKSERIIKEKGIAGQKSDRLGNEKKSERQKRKNERKEKKRKENDTSSPTRIFSSFKFA